MLNIIAHWIDQYCNNGARIKTTLHRKLNCQFRDNIS